MQRDVEHSPSRTPGHSRQASVRKQVLLRQSTVDPLNATEDPLVDETANLSLQPAEDDPLAASTILMPQQAQTDEDAESPVPEPNVTVIDRAGKNFGFLIVPENFLPIDQQDVPAPFREQYAGQRSRKALEQSLQQCHYRAAASTAGELLKSCDPLDYQTIFRLFYIRLACLQIVGLYAHAAQEVKPLQDLSAPFFRERGKHLAPWELRVLVVRLQALAFDDWRRGIMTYYELAREARYEARRAAVNAQAMWTARLRDLGLRVGNALIEINDMEGAVRHLKTMPTADEAESNAMQARFALLYLRCGDVEAARRCFQLGDERSRLLHPLCTMAEGDFDQAGEMWAALKDNMDESLPEAAMVTQALATCRLYIGSVQEARDLLESLVQPHGALNSIAFNLSTVYELTSDNNQELKLKLAQHIASERVSSGAAWDKSNAHFKL